jgi:hypothetical protein
MNWDYLIIAVAIAASLAYLARRRFLRKHAHNACVASSCACCPRASANGTRNDD